MEKIIEGFSFDQGDQSSSFEGNILGQNWDSMHRQMIHHLQDPASGRGDREPSKNRIVKSKSQQAETKTRFIINRKRVNSNIKMNSQDQDCSLKKCYEDERLKEREKQNLLIVTMGKTKQHFKCPEKEKPKVQTQPRKGLSPAMVEAIQERKELRIRRVEKENWGDRRRLQDVLLFQQQKINSRLPELRKLKIQNLKRPKNHFHSSDVDELLIVQRLHQS